MRPRRLPLIINSGSSRFAEMKMSFPMPTSAPLNSATIAPITDNGAAIRKPGKEMLCAVRDHDVPDHLTSWRPP